MVFLTYENYQLARKIILNGTDEAGNIAAGACFEIPVIGPIIAGLMKGLGWLLGWALLKILELIPHENEPRPKSFDWLPLHEPGHVFYVQDPRFVLNTKTKIKDALKDIIVTDPKMEPITSVNDIINKQTIIPWSPLNLQPEGFPVNYTEGVPNPGVFRPKYNTSYHPKRQIQFNPTIPSSGGFR
jgi:hypothetical protein